MNKFNAWFSGAGRGSEKATTTKASAPEVVVIGSPVQGILIPLGEVEDTLFASGVMGPGVAVRPTIGELRAPFAGTVQAVFPTGHAVGMASDSGLEVLIHIGIDTVDLRGAHFHTDVVAGQRVTAGELLVSFDVPAIRGAGYILTTPIVVVNSQGWTLAVDAAPGEVRVGDALITATHTADVSTGATT